MNIKFSELQEYLNSRNCFGLTVSRSKHILVYHFQRYYNKIKLSFDVIVSRKTKCVIAVTTDDNTYKDMEEIKAFVK